MCIRDSDGTIFTSLLIKDITLTSLQKDTVVSAGMIELRTCLLYTSDAADERSSVDLGGRRIIKKKKNT